MVFEVQSGNTWINLVDYWAFDYFDATDNDIDGPHAGRSMSGLMKRDYLGTKMKWPFVSKPMSKSECLMLLNAVRPESYYIRTDTVTGSVTRHHCYSNNRTLKHIVTYEDGTEVWKCTFPIIEL